MLNELDKKEIVKNYAYFIMPIEKLRALLASSEKHIGNAAKLNLSQGIIEGLEHTADELRFILTLRTDEKAIRNWIPIISKNP
jgi:hypothetical protein